ncbi:MAG: response regulator [Holophaga sp.]|nr:response regulator [Holophaga sp.]
MSTLLIVDDRAENRYLLECLFQAQGYPTLSADNGAAALDLARRQPPALVISDILMPEMDGFEFCRRMRLDPNLQAIPIIIYTATYTDPKDEALALGAGADRFLVKPQEPAVLLDAVRSLLARGAELRPPVQELDFLRQHNEALFLKLNKKVQELEQRVGERTRELEAANKELETFAYSVSHDLRAPLRHMGGFLNLLEHHLGTGLDPEGTHFLQVAQAANVRMEQLVDALLSFSRLGRAELHVQEIAVNPMLDLVIEEFRDEWSCRKVQWQVEPLPPLQCDPTLARLVLQNLVGNALKFTRGRAEAVIQVQPIPGLADETGFVIRDNGAGFDPAYSHKLFGVFQRLHRQDEFEGTGIGLANVHRIVSRHGGRIWAEGTPDQGAAFFIALPHKAGQPQQP